MITLVWRVVRDSPVTLTTREVCVFLKVPQLLSGIIYYGSCIL